MRLALIGLIAAFGVFAQNPPSGSTGTYCAPSSASGTTYTCTPSPAISSYTTGMTVWFKPDVVSGANPTLNINGLGAKNIFGNGSALAAGALQPGAAIPLTYDGTEFTLYAGLIACEPGLGDGQNAITAATYLQSTCYNLTGETVTLAGFRCFSDNSGSSTLNATNSAGTALLTGAIACSTSFAAGTQSATVTLAPLDYIKFTFVADGTTKQSTWTVLEVR